MVFVHTAYEYDKVGILCFLQCLGLEASLSSGGHFINSSIHRTTSLISLGKVNLVAIESLECFEGRDVALGLKLRRTSTLTHVADSIVTNNKDTTITRGVERENVYIFQFFNISIFQ